ncbi:MAG: oligosaccharide flippase family protein [Candidatus Omnitrophica bacterium]|nr:oligosaccharide flippase family protein [Candidatus Omnitrophota bacterium]
MTAKYLKDTFWNSADFFTSVVVTLVTTKIIVTSVGLDGYGLYSLFNSVISTLGLFDIGSGIAISKYLAEYIPQHKYHEGNEIITIGLIFYTAVGGIIFIALFVLARPLIDFFAIADIYRTEALQVILLLPVIVTASLLQSIPQNVLVAYEDWRLIAWINMIFQCLNLALIIGLVFLGLGPRIIAYLFYGLSVTFLLKLVLTLCFAKKKHPELKLTMRISAAEFFKITDFLRYSFLQYVLSVFLGHPDKFIIGKVFGLEVLGIYHFCSQAFGYMFSFLSNIFKIIFPKLSETHGRQDFAGLIQLSSRGIKYILAAAVLLVLPVGLIWRPAIGIYLNPQFAQTSFPLMIIFLIYLIARSPTIIYYYFYNSIAKPKILVENLIVILLIVVPLYVILTPMIGIRGPVLAQIIATLGGLYHFFRKTSDTKVYTYG